MNVFLSHFLTLFDLVLYGARWTLSGQNPVISLTNPTGILHTDFSAQLKLKANQYNVYYVLRSLENSMSNDLLQEK